MIEAEVASGRAAQQAAARRPPDGFSLGVDDRRSQVRVQGICSLTRHFLS